MSPSLAVTERFTVHVQLQCDTDIKGKKLKLIERHFYLRLGDATKGLFNEGLKTVGELSFSSL